MKSYNSYSCSNHYSLRTLMIPCDSRELLEAPGKRSLGIPTNCALVRQTGKSGLFPTWRSLRAAGGPPEAMLRPEAPSELENKKSNA